MEGQRETMLQSLSTVDEKSLKPSSQIASSDENRQNSYQKFLVIPGLCLAIVVKRCRPEKRALVRKPAGDLSTVTRSETNSHSPSTLSPAEAAQI